MKVTVQVVTQLPRRLACRWPTYDEKPKRRFFELLQSQGLQMNQQIEFLSDGGDTVRDLQLYLSPEAEHVLDWFPITMRLTTLTQTAKGLPAPTSPEGRTLRDDVVRELERSKWFLWHGTVFQALQELRFVAGDLEATAYESDNASAWKLGQAVQEFATSIAHNGGFIPHYGERYRNGERISTGGVASTVNSVVSKRMVQKQHMRWSKRGAHLLLQIRTRVLNGAWEATFRQCHRAPGPLLGLTRRWGELWRGDVLRVSAASRGAVAGRHGSLSARPGPRDFALPSRLLRGMLGSDRRLCRTHDLPGWRPHHRPAHRLPWAARRGRTCAGAPAPSGDAVVG